MIIIHNFNVLKEFSVIVPSKTGSTIDDKITKASSSSSQSKEPATPRPTIGSIYSNEKNSIDDEFILITGPIYIPKSLLRYSIDSEVISHRNSTATYSVVHNRVDGIKHEVSYASDYRKNVNPGIPITKDNLVINSDAFQTPAKVLQIASVGTTSSTLPSSIPTKESELLNRYGNTGTTVD